MSSCSLAVCILSTQTFMGPAWRAAYISRQKFRRTYKQFPTHTNPVHQVLSCIIFFFVMWSDIHVSIATKTRMRKWFNHQLWFPWQFPLCYVLAFPYYYVVKICLKMVSLHKQATQQYCNIYCECIHFLRFCNYTIFCEWILLFSERTALRLSCRNSNLSLARTPFAC